MVKLIVLDVDGVIVGHTPGVNFPYPSPKIISKLKEIREKGIPIVLCSGKNRKAIEPIAISANLNNPHITDGGGLITDPTANKIIKAFSIDKKTVSSIINTCFQNNIYVEAFSPESYLIQKDVFKEYANRRHRITQTNPIIADSLSDETRKHQIIKLIIIAFNQKDKLKIENLMRSYQNQVSLVWSMHPSTKPWEYYIVTASETSKPNALKQVAQSLKISLEDTLGVGDTLGDWGFMQLCGYAAAMGDAPDELKKLIASKSERRYLVAPSVEDDGILKVFDYFL